jgi:ABC-type multidrug transport system fused ATPase/permease subunit
MKNFIIDFINYSKIYYGYLGGRIFIIFALTILSGLLDSVGILMIFPLIATFSGSGINPGLPSDSLISKFVFVFEGVPLEWLLILVGAIFLIKSILSFSATAYSAVLRADLLKALKLKLFNKYVKMNYEYYLERDSGHFVNVINDQTSRSIQAFQNLTQFASQIIKTSIYLLTALAVSVELGILVVVLGVIFFTLFYNLNSQVKKLSAYFSNESGVLSLLFIESIQAFPYLSATNQYKALKKRVNHSVESLRSIQARLGTIGAFTLSVREPVAVTILLSLVAFQIFVLSGDIAPVLVSLLLFYRAFNALMGVQAEWQYTLEFIGGLLLYKQEISNIESKANTEVNVQIPSENGSIRFSNVSYYYPSTKNAALNGVSFTIPDMSTIAFVGKSGSGKSTIALMLTGLLMPTDGEFFVKKSRFKHIPMTEWRNSIGYVAQDPIFFNDSILNNITMWAEDASENCVIRSAKDAHIHDFILTLPDGYNTIIGDRGVRLSGGQKQRLAIARELYRSPRLLILDEATSALDAIAEVEIQNCLNSLNGKITIVVIAHRLSTIKNSDIIYVLDKGSIIDHGNFDELCSSDKSYFSELVEKQSL